MQEILAMFSNDLVKCVISQNRGALLFCPWPCLCLRAKF